MDLQQYQPYHMWHRDVLVLVPFFPPTTCDFFFTSDYVKIILASTPRCYTKLLLVRGVSGGKVRRPVVPYYLQKGTVPFIMRHWRALAVGVSIFLGSANCSCDREGEIWCTDMRGKWELPESGVRLPLKISIHPYFTPIYYLALHCSVVK